MLVSDIERCKYISRRYAAGLARKKGIYDSPFEGQIHDRESVSRKAVDAYLALRVEGIK